MQTGRQEGREYQTKLIIFVIIIVTLLVINSKSKERVQNVRQNFQRIHREIE